MHQDRLDQQTSLYLARLAKAFRALHIPTRRGRRIDFRNDVVASGLTRDAFPNIADADHMRRFHTRRVLAYSAYSMGLANRLRISPLIGFTSRRHP